MDKTPSKGVAGGTDKLARGGLSRKPSAAGRVVKSRYRAAAAAPALRNSDTSSDTPSFSAAHKEPPASAGKPVTLKRCQSGTKLKERPNAAVRSLLRNKAFTASSSSSGSSSSLSRTNSFGKCSRPRPISGRPRAAPRPPSPPALHSTALNATALGSAANVSQFSSTVISQRTRPALGLGDLPDISVIRLEDTSDRSRESPLSAEPPPPPPLSPDLAVGGAALELAWLRLASWGALRVAAHAARRSQMPPLARELAFLEAAAASEREEADTLRRKIRLLLELRRLHAFRTQLLPLLRQLCDGSPEWLAALQQLSAHLEQHLRHLTLAPAHLPDTQEEIAAPLRELAAVVRQLLALLPDTRRCRAAAAQLTAAAAAAAKLSSRVDTACCRALQLLSLRLSQPPPA